MTATMREARLIIGFTRMDVWTTVIPMPFFFIAGLKHADGSPAELAAKTVGAIVYLWLFVYTFTLNNQLTGVEEDRLNKPFRPLVTGAVTTQEARIRFLVTSALFPVTGWLLGVLWWALAWMAITFVYNAIGGGRNWVVKNLCNGIGVFLLTAATWQIATPLTSTSWRWVIFMASIVAILSPLQDLRDVPGDIAAGRRTIPIALGDIPARICLAAGFTALPIGAYFTLYNPSPHRGWALAAALISLLMSWTIVYRLRRRDDTEHDQRTYRLWEQWFTFIFISSIAVI